MSTKPYNRQEDEETSQVNDPMAAYHRLSADTNLHVLSDAELEIILRSKEEYERGEYYTQEEVNKLMKQWLS